MYLQQGLCWFQGQVCFSLRRGRQGLISCRILGVALLSAVCVVSRILNLFDAKDHFSSLKKLWSLLRKISLIPENKSMQGYKTNHFYWTIFLNVLWVSLLTYFLIPDTSSKYTTSLPYIWGSAEYKRYYRIFIMLHWNVKISVISLSNNITGVVIFGMHFNWRKS